jgi:hypothetical protein
MYTARHKLQDGDVIFVSCSHQEFISLSHRIFRLYSSRISGDMKMGLLQPINLLDYIYSEPMVL